MTPEALHKLIAAGETLDVKFKGEETRPVSDAELLEPVVCLANRPGDECGWLLVGVEDDGRVTGARPRHGERTDPVGLQALAAKTAVVLVVPGGKANLELVRMVVEVA